MIYAEQLLHENSGGRKSTHSGKSPITPLQEFRPNGLMG